MYGYNAKLYTLSGDYVRTISPREIMSSIRYSSQLNGGQGEVRLTLRDGVEILPNQILRLYYSGDYSVSRLVYSGVVGNVKKIYSPTGESIDARVVGLSLLFARVLYRNGVQYTFTKEDLISNIVKSIADSAIALYPGIFSYSSLSIPDSSSTIKKEFSNMDALGALREMQSKGSEKWWIDESGVIHYREDTGVIHYLTYERDIQDISIEENTEGIENEVHVLWSAGANIISDAPSIASYGVRQAILKSSDIKDSSSANIVGGAYTDKKKGTEYKIQLRVNRAYDIDSLKAGDLVSVRNFAGSIENRLIVKASIDTDTATLDLESMESLSRTLNR